MREIPLTRGRVAIVDDEDYEALSQFKWCFDGSKGYATRCKSGVKVRMHREIMDAPEGVLIDHINGDRLDNRRSNLRSASHAENSRNKPSRSANGFKGVKFDARRGHWTASIVKVAGGRPIYLGSFYTAAEAARAYDAAAREYHGQFAKLNFPGESGVLQLSLGLEAAACS